VRNFGCAGSESPVMATWRPELEALELAKAAIPTVKGTTH
jgi:hypothetical protein